jgi:D-sedoheptulose 7-phosphate isomerase
MEKTQGHGMKFGEFANQYIDRLKTVLDAIDMADFERMVRAFLDAYERQARIFIMGNGGSGATASHMACDINKGCCIDLSKKFKMVCLNDNIPTMLALANDLSYDVVFEEQLKIQFTAGDMVLGISGSGNSANVLRAIQYAAKNGGRTIGWSGFGGGRLALLVDLALVVESDDMQQVEDAHLIMAHMVMQAVHTALHDKPSSRCPAGPTPIDIAT